MTVTDLLQRILDAYPGATAESMATFKPVFYARLRKHEGEVLEEAATEVLGTFKPTMRQPFPIPLDFEKHLPSGPKVERGKVKSLDIDGHRRRKVEILAEWRSGQGNRAANGVREIMRALEFVAEPIADVMAWDEQPGQLLLKRSEVKTAYHRAISQQRRVLHGAPSSDANVWWDQISAIAAQWGIETTREEWTTKESQVAPRTNAPQQQRPAFVRADTPTNRRMAELAAAHRTGTPPPEHRDIPEGAVA